MGSVPRVLPVERHAPRLAAFFISAAYSPVLKLLLVVAHVLPVLAALGTGVPVAVRVLVIVGALASAAFQLRRWARLQGLRLHLLPQGEMQIEVRGVQQDVQLQPGSVDMGWLVVLAWRANSERVERCALTRDGVGDEAWRALKIWLRWRPESSII